MKSDLEIKADIFKSMSDVFRGEEAASWKDVLDGPKKEEEPKEESCECDDPECPICSKGPKGKADLDVVVAVPKPKK